MLMLRACRMECLLKALYVANGNRLGVNGRFVPPKGKSHDLVTLAREANLSLTLEAECLLGYLGQFITQGRYPVGTRSPDAFRVLASGAPRSKIWSAEGEGEYKALDKRLGAEVGRRIRETMSA